MHVLSLWHTLPRPLRIVVMRCLMIVPQMLGVTLVAFLLVRLLPGDPARLILGNFATADFIRLMRERLGLDQSLPVAGGAVSRFRAARRPRGVAVHLESSDRRSSPESAGDARTHCLCDGADIRLCCDDGGSLRREAGRH